MPTSNSNDGSNPPHLIPTSDNNSISWDESNNNYPDTNIPDDKLIKNMAQPLTTQNNAGIYHDPSNLPSIPPYTTPAPYEHRNIFDSLYLHMIFGCHKICNQRYVTGTANTELIHTGALPATFGAFVTIPNLLRGKPIHKHRKYIDKVYMDIIFGDCAASGWYHYALLCAAISN